MRAYDGTVRNQSVWAWTTCMHKDFMCPLLTVYRGAPMAHEVLCPIGQDRCRRSVASVESSFFNRTVEETLSALGGTKAGLTSKEAAERLQKHGKNALAEGKKKSGLQVFLDQFKDLLVVILIIAALISMVSDNVESTVVIFAVLILNAVLGTVQHFKAEKSLESLKAMSSPSAKVLRDGVRSVVPSAQVVPGDIVELEAGDMVVADGRILESFSLKVNESSLTGESEGVEKTSDVIAAEKVALGDQKNMVFSGSLVTYGRATVVVTGTGMDTELGKVCLLYTSMAKRGV